MLRQSSLPHNVVDMLDWLQEKAGNKWEAKRQEVLCHHVNLDDNKKGRKYEAVTFDNFVRPFGAHY